MPDEQYEEQSKESPFQIRNSEMIKVEKLNPIISEERKWNSAKILVTDPKQKIMQELTTIFGPIQPDKPLL